MQCDGAAREAVTTGKPVAIAWDNYNDRTVMVWVHQNRMSSADSRQVMLSVGTVDDRTLATPTIIDDPGDPGTPLRVKSTPGIACSAFSAGIYDCVLAYAAEDRTDNRVYTRRFWARWNGSNYDLMTSMEQEEHAVTFHTKTASAIAVWHHNGEFWIAIRKSLANQMLALYRSPEGADWSFHGAYWHSVVGPTAVSYAPALEHNYLVYAAR